ncbi:alpha/beta-hydrolase [Phaeosphaeriaceae sp. SRC1lsM3a]|nr:alpha/beta-hydrolase [Stagonospora sp. SRC1lsM3a]
MSKHIHIVEPRDTHTHTIILLHGRGSNATEFASEFFESQASDDKFLGQIFPTYKWVFPCAALRHAQIEGEELHQWFDMECVQKPYQDPDKLQTVGLRESLEFIRNVIEREAREAGGFDKVFLGGISQGCATAITACLTVQKPLAGFIAFSGWFPFARLGSEGFKCMEDLHALVESLHDVVVDSRKPDTSVGVENIRLELQTPVLVEHALDDEVVPHALGRDLRDTLVSFGSEVQLEEYQNGGHWINEPKGIDDMVDFIKSKAIG